MRVFISSTPSELEPHRQAAAAVVCELGGEPLLRDPAPRRGLDPVTACGRQVALADAMLAIVGWRRDPVPSVDDGGDGLRPWSHWQVKSAVDHGVPVVALLAGEALRPEARQETPEARAALADLRGELARVSAVFDGDAEFRRQARDRLRRAAGASGSSKSAPASAVPAGAAPAGLRLRRYPPPELPPHPYPLLLPYSHPELMAGRDRDLADLRRLLDSPVTAVGLHAASGTGKSSLLAGGLVPALRAEGRPVAFVRHPAEPGLTARLLGDLVERDPVERDPVDRDPVDRDPVETADRSPALDARAFADWLAIVRRLAAGRPPVLVIDQLEDLFRGGTETARAAAARATLGPLLAASAQRLPGMADPVCRWLLAYRQEFHGRLVEWLEDVLHDARRAGLEQAAGLPHDLSRPSRFAVWPLRPLAAPAPGSDDPAASATRVFLAAIEKPLRRGIYPWAFAPGDAERLARAFGEARVRRPNAPLAPELQVVLAHLLEGAGEPVDGRRLVVEVPAEPAELIDKALETHLRRALDAAFPQALDAGESDARIARTRALLALRELAGAGGRRGDGHDAGALARALGEQGREVLEKLSTPRTRLVLLEQRSGAWVYVLAHDRLAEVLVRVVDEGGWAGLDVDAELLALRRLVALQSQLHAAGDAVQATAMPRQQFRNIEAHREVLLWSQPQWAWWQACRERRRRERRRGVARRAAAVAVAATVALGAWTVADRRARRRALLDEVAAGEPEAAFAALDRLSLDARRDRTALADRLRERRQPFDVFERGLGGVAEERRVEALLRVAELALPVLETSPEDPVLIASLLWALDLFAAREEAVTERLPRLRERVLRPLRRSRPPPPRPAAGDPEWADVPAGGLQMTAGPGSDKPARQVKLSAFRILTHEVTNAEYRRLEPHHAPGTGDHLPVIYVGWYAAYTYAAWLGGRLPTEAEWEYAARAGCGRAFCKRDGGEATLSDVAWWIGNAADPETGNTSPRPVMRLEPNPWGLWDLYGNVWEWSATWSGVDREAPGRDPPGPTASATGHRLACGGGDSSPSELIVENRRTGNPPSHLAGFGFRVVIPGVSAGAPAAGTPAAGTPAAGTPAAGITTRRPR